MYNMYIVDTAPLARWQGTGSELPRFKLISPLQGYNQYNSSLSPLQGYNQYNFPEALWQIEKSTQILETLLNSKHAFIAASWRLKALLLEGLAANTDDEQVQLEIVR